MAFLFAYLLLECVMLCNTFSIRKGSCAMVSVLLLTDGEKMGGGSYSIKRRCSNEGCMQSSTILLIRLHVFYIFSFCYLYDVICLLYDALKCP